MTLHFLFENESWRRDAAPTVIFSIEHEDVSEDDKVDFSFENPPTPSAVERVRTTCLCLTLNLANPGRIHVLPSPFRLLTPAHPGKIHDLLKSQKSRKWQDFNKNGTPEALDEPNPYSLTSRNHWEGSRALERGAGPQKWGRRHGEAFLIERSIFLLKELSTLKSAV